MRVLHLINELPKQGGAERLLLDLARKAGSDHPIKVITWLSGNTDLEELDIDGVLDILPLRPFAFSKIQQARQWFRDADVVHVHLFPSLYLGAMLAKPKVFTEHNTWNRRRNYSLLRWIERFFYGRYQCVIAISEAAGATLNQWLGKSLVPIVIIDNGIDLSRFPRKPLTPISSTTGKVVGMAASFTSQKDQDCLIRALKRLPSGYRLAFAGDGPRLPEVRALAQSLGVEDRVDFLGNIDYMGEFYRSLDFYVQSSHWEGFGLAAVEAMSSGVPCLASDIDGLSSVVDNEAYLFPKSDHVRLAEMIVDLSSTPARLREAVDYGVANAQRFSISKTRDEYLAVYEAVFSRNKIKDSIIYSSTGENANEMRGKKPKE